MNIENEKLLDAVIHAKKILKEAERIIYLYDRNIKSNKIKHDRDSDSFSKISRPSIRPPLIFKVYSEIINTDDGTIQIKLSSKNKKINASICIELHNYWDLYSKTIDFYCTKEKIVHEYEKICDNYELVSTEIYFNEYTILLHNGKKEGRIFRENSDKYESYGFIIEYDNVIIKTEDGIITKKICL